MDIYAAINSRRSVRGYNSTPVEQNKLDRILEAARQAPSACNKQPWEFYVIKSAEVCARLGTAYGAPWLIQAPVVIVACGIPAAAWCRSDGKNYVDVDVTIAMEHIILAATAEGLGTCWIGAFDPKVVREVLALPQGIEPIAMTPLGYSDSHPEPRDRKPLDQIVKVIE